MRSKLDKNKDVKKSLTTDLTKQGTNEFVTCIDGITIGILDGQILDTGRSEWTADQKRVWAKLNAAFFCNLVNRIEMWGLAIKDR